MEAQTTNILPSDQLSNEESNYFYINNANELDEFRFTLHNYLVEGLPNHNHELVILCIGTDRATGDSLGPLIGYKLEHSISYPNVHLYGTLTSPVHARNLKMTTALIKKIHPNALVIAIDACLGSSSKIGYLSLGYGPLQPGAGVNKTLPAVGNLFIKGIVNVNGDENLTTLQNTRLSVVMQMADIIAETFKLCLSNYYNFHFGNTISNTVAATYV